MARFLWLLLPFVGSGFAKEGSVSLFNSASGSYTHSLPVTPLNGLNDRDTGSSFTPQINPLVRRSSACKPRAPLGGPLIADSLAATIQSVTTTGDKFGIATSSGSVISGSTSESAVKLTSSVVSSAASSAASTYTTTDETTTSNSESVVESTSSVVSSVIFSVASSAISAYTTTDETSRSTSGSVVESTSSTISSAVSTHTTSDEASTSTVSGLNGEEVVEATPSSGTTSSETLGSETTTSTLALTQTETSGSSSTLDATSESSSDGTTTTGSPAGDFTSASTASLESETSFTGSTVNQASATASSASSLDTTLELGAKAASTETSDTSTLSSETSLSLTKSPPSTSSSEASLSLTEFPSSTFASPDPTTSSEGVVATSTDSPLVLTVAADGSGDYTAINDAIKAAQTSGYPTVTVLAGTYTENVVIAATQAVTIAGETSKKRDGASGVVIEAASGNTNPALSFNTDAAAGISWKNIKFSNSLTGNSAGAVFLRGSKNAFYNCEFVSAGIAAITGSYASAIIANSYIEAQDKLIYNYPSLYLYGTTITATNSNALLVYNKGATSGSTLYNSTIVFDTCEVVQKSGAKNTRVFLAAGNGDGSVAVFRDTSFASGFLAASGVYVDTKTQSSLNRYVEFGTTGDVSDRSKYMTLITDPKDLSPYEISAFFKGTFPSVAVSSVDWIDSSVLSAIKASNAKDSKEAETTSAGIATTTSESLTTTTSESLNTATSESLTTTASDSLTTTASDSLTTTTPDSCAFPSAVPSTALVVGPKSNPCASYDTVASAVAALPKDDTTQHIYILAGKYQEKVTIQRVGATIVRGQTSDGNSAKNNKVTITSSNGVLSNNGGSSGTATFSANQYEAKLVSFYNINFENAFEAAANTVALAVFAKGTKVAFYGCDISSSQGTLYLDYGNFFISHSILRGTTDFLWGQGAGYVYNSVIVSKGTTTGQAIAAHKFQGQYGGSRFVFDLCAVVPESNSVPEGSTFLGRDYSAKSNVAFVNSYLDGHIASSGWKVSSPSTFAGTFTEGNNTGPGWDASSRASAATIVKDTSSINAAAILGGDAWIDKDSIAPFQGWPDSKYAQDATTTSASDTATATASATTSASEVGSTLTVAPSPTGGQFKTVASALAAIPDDGEDYTVFIKAGSYNEQLNLNRGRGRVTLRGETSFENDFTQNEVLIWFKLGYSTGASRNEETPVLFWKTTTATAGLSLYNLNFTNTYPQTRDTAALAADLFGNNMAAYGCSFEGFQDTLLVNQGVQVFSNSYISGSVDFIWGYSKTYFHQCYIASNTPNAYITAQNRKSSSWAGGFVFDTCKVTYTDSYGTDFGNTALGRPWSQYALVVYMNSFLDKHISKAGWSAWSSSNPQTSDVLFGEFNNTGPGNWTSSRATFATKLTESQAAAYSLGSFIGSTSWLDMKAYNLAPSFTIGDSAAVDSEPEVSWPSHPSDGTTPPKNAVVVSVGGEKSGSYSSLTDALKSLPKDSTPQVIFIYPGAYEEQVPSINRPGPVTIIGYTETEPGKTYTSNQVTITQAKGLSVAGTIPAGRSNADTATIATASTKIAFYNVKFINTDNLDGATPSYVTLAASVYGDKIGFYGCEMIGWQDTLLTGATAGYQYYESCYIDGAIDFIWGYSKAYFKGCTIAAKRAKSAITAHSRKDATAVGGYIFDQCLFTEAASSTVDLAGQVYLGRPYSAYALVVVKNSYLDSIVQPAGWKIWSTSDPRTDHITFAEYANEGPGSWEKNSAAREAFGFATLLTKDDYSLTSVMDSTDWIDKTFWDSIVTPKPTTPVVPVPDPNAVYSGKTPPPGAFIVSKEAIEGVTTYNTIQAAIDALPVSSKVTPTVFIYPGTYKEQIVLSRAGTTFFIGYSESPDDYTKNQVTITYDKGIDTQADASNSDSATFYATGNYFQAVNINFENSFGTTNNYASLGFAVKSSKFASLYGCQVYGNQDALLINGNLFAYNSLFTGNIDMIWGSGAGYFLKSIIAPNKDKIALTANKKGTNTGPNGFVFDQCTVTPADGASFSTIYLGRPWDQFARVAYIQSELSVSIAAVGWTGWTKSDPRTENVIFGEYDNTGPGASTSSRASFAKQLSDEEVAQFQLGTFFPSTSWINMTLVHATPFDAAVAATQTFSSTTVYTTQTVTSSQTLFTTLTGAEVTITEKSTSTQDIGTTITPDPTTKTIIEKATVTETAQVTQADKLVTVKSTEIVDVGKTVTPAVVTETSTQVFDATVTSWVTKPAKAVTTTSTTTGATVTPKSVTENVVERTTVVISKTTSPKPITVKSTTTVVIGTGGTMTTSLKATTVLSTTVTTSVKIVSKTTTLKCIPTQDKRDLGGDVAVVRPRAAVVFGNPSVDLASGLTRRDLDLGSINLEARAAGLSTVTVTVVSTFTTNVKTSIMTVPGSTATTQVITTKTIGKTSTLKPATVIDASTSVATKYVTSTIPGSTSTTTTVTTKETGKTTTLKAATTTVVVASTSVVTDKKTSTAPASTVTVLKTLTTTLPAGTVKVTTTSTVKQTSPVTLDQKTVTNWTTVKSTLKPSSTVTLRSTVSKTTTSVIKETKTVWATRTSKGAAACTN